MNVSYKEVERMQSDLGLLVFSCREPQMVWSQAATRQRAPPASHSGMVRGGEAEGGRTVSKER